MNQFNLYGSLRPFHSSENPLLSSLSLSAAMAYDNYSYPSSVIGLQHSSDYTPSVGVAYQPSEDFNLSVNYSWQATDWNMAVFNASPTSVRLLLRHVPPTPPANSSDLPGASLDQLRERSGQFSHRWYPDFVASPAVEGSQILRNKSKLSINYTYAVSTDLTHANGDAALGPATSFPNIGTQFQELIVQYEYPFKKNMSLELGYYFNHFGENDFAWDNLKSWMGSASPNSTFVGATTWTP